ncbi:MAG: flagellar basal body rod protein FlgC [Oscillospiraceae bacterium]|nr:flagellar basal body rod protein FlgC [Oscillospiraceae bacterium]
MAFLSSLDISHSGLSSQRLRMDIILQNIANQDSYNTSTGEPYCRQLTVISEKKDFAGVLSKYTSREESTHRRGVYYRANMDKYRNAGSVITAVIDDDAPMTPVYDPENPLADENGYIYHSNVDNTKEQTDLLAAQRAYEANASAYEVVKAMMSKAAELKGN